MPGFDPYTIRSQFPALRREVGGRPAVYLDGPGGTQVPESVIDAIAERLSAGISNLDGPFAPSEEAVRVTADARAACADLLNAARPDEIVFGQNMTSLTFSMSRALAATWEPGDEIVVSRLDHDANITPWTLAAADRDIAVRWVDFLPDDGCVLDYDDLRSMVGPRTKLVAVGYASNAVGTVNDIRRVVRIAHDAGALVYVDAVHFAPHGAIDVQALECDFLTASAYKFFGTHTGVLYGKYAHLAAVDAYKVRPAPGDPPGKWETGTQSFESIAGVTAAVDYLASIADPEQAAGRREAIVSAWAQISDYESQLSRRFLDGIAEIEGVRLFGRHSTDQRTPTFAVAVEGIPADQVAAELGAHGIFVWAGHYYAVEVMRRLEVLDSGGLVRIGFVHYNTPSEVDAVVKALRVLASGRRLADEADFQPRSSSAAPLRPYDEFTITGLPDPRDLSRAQLADGLAEIIAVEGPITATRAYQVYVKASGGKKVTKPVRDDLEWAVDLLVADRRIEAEEHRVGDAVQRVLRRINSPRIVARELGSRDLYNVPLSEVAEVMAGLAWSEPESAEEELKRLTLERYGLKRLTPLASSYLDAAMRVAGI